MPSTQQWRRVANTDELVATVVRTSSTTSCQLEIDIEYPALPKLQLQHGSQTELDHTSNRLLQDAGTGPVVCETKAPGGVAPTPVYRVRRTERPVEAHLTPGLVSTGLPADT